MPAAVTGLPVKMFSLSVRFSLLFLEHIGNPDASTPVSARCRLKIPPVSFVYDDRARILSIKKIVRSSVYPSLPRPRTPDIARTECRDEIRRCSVGVCIIDGDASKISAFDAGLPAFFRFPGYRGVSGLVWT